MLMQTNFQSRPASRLRAAPARNSVRARYAAWIACMVGLACAVNGIPARGAEPPLVAYRVDNGEIRVPLTREPGDAARGGEAVLSRDAGNCFLCHTVPAAGEIPLGNIGPPLAGVGKRLNTSQLPVRLVESTRINRQIIMPA